MAVIKHYSDNPKDGLTTFDKVRFYSATDSSGTGATLIGTEDIDVTTTSPISPGYTTYVDTAGNLTKYYASAWYDSTTATESTKSDYVLAGQDRWDTMFQNEMQDTDGVVWSTADRKLFKAKALEALFPDFYRQIIDETLTVVNSGTTVTYIYTVPFGIFSISEVGYGDINQTSTVNRDFKTIKPAYWKFEKNQLRFESLPPWQDGDSIRLVGLKKYLSIGEVPTYLDPLVMEHLRMSAYTKMADDYPRFLKWSQLQQGTRVSFENLRVHAREFERRFNDWKKVLKDNPAASLT